MIHAITYNRGDGKTSHDFTDKKELKEILSNLSIPVTPSQEMPKHLYMQCIEHNEKLAKCKATLKFWGGSLRKNHNI